MARKSAENKRQAGSRQFTVLLPPDTYKRLEALAGNRGIGEEIRRRLGASFEAEKAPADPKTGELLDAINDCAERTASDYGRWSDDAFSFEILKSCVNMLLTYYRPEGDAVPKPNPDGMHDIIFGPDYLPKPEELSRLYVSNEISDRAKRADKEKRK